MEQITVKVNGGILRAFPSEDPDYPGIWTEFIPDDGSHDDAVSHPSVLMEKTDEMGLRALVWTDTQNEDYTDEIKFEFEEETKIYSLPELSSSGDCVKDLAIDEARGTAWNSIGISGNVGFRLAKSSITPKELQKILDDGYYVFGIGKKTTDVIKRLKEVDFEKFDKTYNELLKENSWTWRLAEWRYTSVNCCTNGEYMNKKAQLKKAYMEHKEKA